jgi:hypothetical protein
MPLLAEIPAEYLLFGGAGVVSLLAFATLILAPTLGAYGRGWEKVFASVLSIFILAALVLLGVAAGALIVYFWDEISGWFG